MISTLITKLTHRTEVPLTTDEWRDKLLAEAATAAERTDLSATLDRHEGKLLAA